MVISLFFSASIYQLSIREVYAGYRKQQDILERSPDLFLPPDLRDELYNERAEQYASTREDILGRLVLVNIAILLAGGFISYFLARRTIRPIEKAHEAQRRFTADASHELRTPLAVMQSEIEVSLMDPKLNIKAAKKQMKSSLEELARLKGLSEGLLQLSQLEDENLDRKISELSEIIKLSIRDNKPLADKKKIRLSLISNPRRKIFVDAEGIRKVLNILIENAIKYSPNSSEVRINSQMRDKKILINIEDRGIGIQPEEIRHIFDRFYRADSARTKSEAGGYGLGLSIAKSIVQQHGGTISVNSTPGRQTVFSVSLPGPG
jgi:signal transduction histidine kinase